MHEPRQRQAVCSGLRARTAITDYGAPIALREALHKGLGDDWPVPWRNDLAGAYMNRDNAKRYRELLTESQRLGFHAPASDKRGMVRDYTLSSEDLAQINRRRGDPNRLGFAARILCYLRFPGPIFVKKNVEVSVPSSAAFYAFANSNDAVPMASGTGEHRSPNLIRER